MLEIYVTDENFERLRRAHELGRKEGNFAATQIALAWVLHKSFSIFPIVGPHNIVELRSCIAALSISLTD